MCTRASKAFSSIGIANVSRSCIGRLDEAWKRYFYLEGIVKGNDVRKADFTELVLNTAVDKLIPELDKQISQRGLE